MKNKKLKMKYYSSNNIYIDWIGLDWIGLD
jgi:hypothetical protein